MIFEKLFRRSPSRIAGDKLYVAAIGQARQPAFYADLGAPDTVEGRFELYTLHVVLLLHRLSGLGRGASPPRPRRACSTPTCRRWMTPCGKWASAICR